MTVPVHFRLVFAPGCLYIVTLELWDEIVEVQAVQRCDNAVDVREVLRRKQPVHTDGAFC